MLIVLSPAKTLNFDHVEQPPFTTEPRLLDEAQTLINRLRKLSSPKLQELMSISPALATLNRARYQQWAPDHGPSTTKPAAFAFDGDVYDGLRARTLDAQALQWAQDHVRILSGLYGVLRPLDRMRPYRLEMGSVLPVARSKNLYSFWGHQPAQMLASDAKLIGATTLVNLASDEYFRAVDRNVLGLRVIQPVFQDETPDGSFKVISFLAKRARGAMARAIIERRIAAPEQLRKISIEGFVLEPQYSDDERWVFRRALQNRPRAGEPASESTGRS
jgi:cytoplasmic iron level regulating protein YaaA (DUF328/UPF0246 family)